MKSRLRIVFICAIVFTLACQISTTPIIVATETPTITPGGPTLTPSPTITSTPFPTPVPVVRIDAGDKALFYGDFEAARQQYLSAFNDTTDKDIKAAALWGLGRTELADGRFEPAIEKLITLTTDYPESTYSARAYFLMGQTYFNLGRFQESANAYNMYSTRIPGVLDAYVQ